MNEPTPLVDVARSWQSLITTPDGAMVIGWLVSKFGYTRESTFDENHALMSRREGQRDVVRAIGTLLDADITKMEEEVDR